MEQGFRKARPRSGTARWVLLSIAKKPKCVARATGAHVRCGAQDKGEMKRRFLAGVMPPGESSASNGLTTSCSISLRTSDQDYSGCLHQGMCRAQALTGTSAIRARATRNSPEPGIVATIPAPE